jgi:hypothetical protein
MKNIPNLLLKGFLASLIMLLAYSCKNTEAETTVIITVRDNNSNLVQGASVTLYKSLSDLTYSNPNTIYKVTNTDASGQAKFTGVDSGIDYYFDASQGGKDNSTGNNHVGSVTKPHQTSYASTIIQ